MQFSEFEDFLAIEKNYTVHTVNAYLGDLKKFCDFCGQNFPDTDLRFVDYSLVRLWIVQMAENGLTNRSINRKISALQAYYNFLLQTGQIKASPLVKYKSLKVSKSVLIPFSQKEMREFYNLEIPDTFEGVRDRLLIELLYATGIRRSELIRLKVGDCSGSSKTLKVTGKGNKQRMIPLLPTIFGTLALYMEKRNALESIAARDRDYLFLTRQGRKLYPTLVYRVVRQYFSLLSTKHKISPHVLRHTFATHLLNEGADINSIKSLLGHESLASTQVYTHNDIDALKKVYKNAHPRSRAEGRRK